MVIKDLILAKLKDIEKKEKVIILLHSFIKKQQKIPAGELAVARKRLKEVKERSAA